MLRLFSTRVLRTLALGLTSAITLQATAQATLPRDPAARAKHQVASKGVGNVVRIERKDGSQIRGEIVAIGGEAFNLRVSGMASAFQVQYVDVKKVKGEGLPKSAKIGIGVSVAGSVGVMVFAMVLAHGLRASTPAH